jgi:hypothetical protein
VGGGGVRSSFSLLTYDIKKVERERGWTRHHPHLPTLRQAAVVKTIFRSLKHSQLKDDLGRVKDQLY